MRKPVLLSFALATSSLLAQSPSSVPTQNSSASQPAMGVPHIAAGSKLFLEPMGGYETSLSAALINKKVPVIVTDDRTKADYILTGTSHLEEAGWAKTIFVSPGPHAEASISIKDSKTGDLVFAYNVDKFSARKGNQSTAEACAKHLKEFIEKK